MIIQGTRIARAIRGEISKQVKALGGRAPCLAVILVGQDPASEVYVRLKKRDCAFVGIESLSHHLPEDTEESELLELIAHLNEAPHCDGILVQLPLPEQIDPRRVIHALDPGKDVDGFHPENMGRLLIGETGGFVPCTPLGVQVLLQRSGISVDGKHVVIVGRSTIVGKPLAALLMQRTEGANATVTIAHRGTQNLADVCRTADILVTAMGRPLMIGADMVKKGAVVVDVGINRVDDPSSHQGYRLVGDVDFDALKNQCSAITPVPGGVGPLTRAMLLHNTLLAYQKRRERCAIS